MPRNHPVFAAFLAAFPVSMPVLAGYLFLGAAYGVLMNSIGYGPFWTTVMSVVVFGGTIQFVATSLLAAAYAPLNALAVSLMLNARHLFYGVSMLERYAGTGWKKPFLVFWLTDETFSLVCSDDIPPGVDRDWFRFFVSVLNYLYWITGGLVGNIAGHAFSFDTQGIEFVMTSLFAVIVINQWRAATSRIPALAGLGASLVCLAVFGPANFLIPAMILIVLALLAFRSRWEERTEDAPPGACR